MRQDQPSRTAARVALRRAAHRLVDRPLVFDDPLALAILDPATRQSLEADPGKVTKSRLARALRAFLVVRSRVAEDTLASLVARGLRQYVVLGAGLDTFASRNPWPGLRVFEVDHPATQRWKKRRVAEAGLNAPPTVTYVPVDFAQQDLGTELARAGLATDQAAFFSWLGVTPYLEVDVTWSTLRWVAAATHTGGGIVFDYSTPPSDLPLVQRLVFALVASRVKRAGEPFRGFFRPEALVADLRALGFASVEDLGPTEINRRYFAGRTDGLAVGSAGHLATALREPASASRTLS